jgi:hypothetical protein
MCVSRTRDNNFSFSVTSKEAVVAVQKKFKGKGVSTADVVEKLKRPAYVKTSFDALNALYALCAIGGARIDRRYKGKALVFQVNSKSAD